MSIYICGLLNSEIHEHSTDRHVAWPRTGGGGVKVRVKVGKINSDKGKVILT